MAVFPNDIVDVNLPHFCSPFAHVGYSYSAGLNGRHGAGEGSATAVGHLVITERAGIADDGFYVLVVDSEFFGNHQ